MKKVTTKKVDSSKEFYTIKNVKYKIGDINVRNSGEVFYLEDKDTWYILKNGKICWDIDENRYRLFEEVSDKKHAYIIDADKIKNDYEIGYSSQVFPNLDVDISSGINIWPGSIPDEYWLPSCNRYLVRRNMLTLNTARNYYQNKPEYTYYDPRAYTIEPGYYGKIQELSEVTEKTLNMPEAPEVFNVLSKSFNDTSIGCEVETSFGSIPNQYLNLYGFRPVRDGSINGWEYINYPYGSNSKDLWKLYQFFDVASKFTRADDQCSLHYHIGNVPQTKEFIVSIYTLVYCLQQELHQICLPYKKDARYLSKKRDMKDHCQALLPLGCTNKGLDLQQKLDNIVSFFNEDFVSNYNPAKKIRYSLDGKNKWDTHSRYYILNLIPLLFKGKANTVEFRLRHGTVNKYDAFYWLLICNALIQFASIRSEEILKLKYKYELSDIINEIYPQEIACKLCAYINFSKISYEECKIKGDMYNNTYTTHFNEFANLFYSFCNDNINKVPEEINFLPELTNISEFRSSLDLHYNYKIWPKFDAKATTRKSKSTIFKSTDLSDTLNPPDRLEAAKISYYNSLNDILSLNEELPVVDTNEVIVDEEIDRQVNNEDFEQYNFVLTREQYETLGGDSKKYIVYLMDKGLSLDVASRVHSMLKSNSMDYRGRMGEVIKEAVLALNSF